MLQAFHQSVELLRAAASRRKLFQPLAEYRVERLMLGFGQQAGPLDQLFIRIEGDLFHTQVVCTNFVRTSKCPTIGNVSQEISVLRGRVYRGELDVIEGGVFGAIGSALDAQRIACVQGDARMRWRAEESALGTVAGNRSSALHSAMSWFPRYTRNREMPFNWSK